MNERSYSILVEQKYLTSGLILDSIAVSSSQSGGRNAASSGSAYIIKQIIPSMKTTLGQKTAVGGSSVVRPENAKGNRDESLEGRMAGLQVIEAHDPTSTVDIFAMNWKTELVFATNGDQSKDVEGDQALGAAIEDGKAKASKIHTSPAPRKGATPALPSYINIYPPAAITTPSSSVSASVAHSAYASLGGLSTQIKQIRSLIDIPLSSTHAHLYTQFGLLPPRGILLYGPPGTGKTHLSRAIASSTPGCSCIVVNGPELSSAYHGETEERIRAVFEEAGKREPCIIVLDEIDTICPRREGGESSGGEVERRVVATVLTLMDGMAQKENVEGKASKRVVVIAATNRPNAVDPALRRPGRFDREIEIGKMVFIAFTVSLANSLKGWLCRHT